MKIEEQILVGLPYSKPFLFVDEIHNLDDNGVEGSYTFREDEFFYAGHFIGNPVTPGVILTECMAQIGLVAFGMYLLGKPNDKDDISLAFTSSDVEFLALVKPGEKLVVKAEKEFWRLGKLKVFATMHNEAGVLVCRGSLSGMIKQN